LLIGGFTLLDGLMTKNEKMNLAGRSSLKFSSSLRKKGEMTLIHPR
jgi:hypothetical protein